MSIIFSTLITLTGINTIQVSSNDASQMLSSQFSSAEERTYTTPHTGVFNNNISNNSYNNNVNILILISFTKESSLGNQYAE